LRQALCIRLAAAAGVKAILGRVNLLGVYLVDCTVYSVKCIRLSSSVMTSLRSTLRISFIVIDFFLNCEYALLLLFLDDVTVLSVMGVVYASALLSSRLVADTVRLRTV